MADDKFYIQVDDSAFTVGADDVSAMGMLADETTPDSVDEGDIGIPRMTLDRKQLNVLVDATTDSQRLAIDSNGSASAILAANSGVDIGDVTINNAAGASAVNIQDGGNSITVDGAVTATTNFEYAEDSAHTTGATGAFVLAVRNDAGTALAGLDGDYIPLSTDSTGALRTTASLTSNVEYAEDSPHTTADTGNFILAVRRDTATSGTSLDGDYASLNVNSSGDLYTTLDGETVTIQDGGNVISIDDAAGSITIDNSTLSVVGGGTEAAALRVTIANDSTGLLSVDDNGGSLTIDNSTLAVVGGGTEATALRVTIANDSTGVLSIDDNGGSLTVDGSVTVTQGTHDSLNANANIQVGDVDVSNTNPVPVTIVDPEASTTEIHNYSTATVAAGSTSNHDYTATGGTFLLRQITLSASGGAKVEVINDAAGTPATVAVFFIPVGVGGSVSHTFTPAVEVANTNILRLTRTNRQGGSQDLYSTIEGNQL